MILGKGNEIHCWLISVPQFIESYPLRALNDPLLDHSFGHKWSHNSLERDRGNYGE